MFGGFICLFHNIVVVVVVININTPNQSKTVTILPNRIDLWWKKKWLNETYCLHQFCWPPSMIDLNVWTWFFSSKMDWFLWICLYWNVIVYVSSVNGQQTKNMVWIDFGQLFNLHIAMDMISMTFVMLCYNSISVNRKIIT